MNASKVLKASIIILALLFTLAMVSSVSYRVGHRDGVDTGLVIALDTMNVLMVRQLRSDTSCSKVTIQSTDTLTYILSRKTLLHEL